MIQLEKIDWGKVGFFRFKEIGNNKYLLSNDAGEFAFLSGKEFNTFLLGQTKVNEPTYNILRERGFLRDQLDLPALVSKYRKKNLFFKEGTTLHIIVATLRCDHKCIYCQSASREKSEKGFDLDIGTAKKIIDAIFRSPSRSLAIEFQGGEPLLNWPVVRFAVGYALEKNKSERKDLELRLVSNFSFMDEKKLSFLSKNRVTLCTSLDGPEELHNRNRVLFGGDSYNHTIKWLKKAQETYRKMTENKFKPGAIVTVSRNSLRYPEEIVDEYIKNGIDSLFIRPLTPLGMAGRLWEKIGYTAEEYLRFYKKALNHAISYGLKHPESRFHENTAKIFLAKILTEYDPNYLDLRSPCGAGIGQLLYNYDGKVYTCDEARMIGEDIFCLGDIKKDAYKNLVAHPTLKVMAMASCLDNSGCDFCVYKPYCGVCPVYNWAQSGNIFSQAFSNSRCSINRGILDFLFEKIQNKKIRIVFQRWANYTLP